MALIENGIIKGKLGTLVGCTWKGRPYLRRRGVRTSPATQGEKRNQFAFKLVNSWLKPVHDFVRVGFRNYSQTVWGINAASSLLHKEALHRDGFNSSIDPALVKLSAGSIELPVDLEVLLEDDHLLFYWSTEVGPGKNAKDRIMMLAYNVDAGISYMELSGPQRFQGFGSLSIKPVEEGIYHIYAAFIGTATENQSGSRYLGAVEVI